MPESNHRPRVLYVASGGVAEPLIESQVLAYLRKLRPSLELCHLITLERGQLSISEQASIRSRLANNGLDWTPVVRSRWAGPANPLRNLALGVRIATRLHRRYRFSFVHARSFFPGMMARQLKRRLGLPYVYDMRGLWVFEKRAKGSLRTSWLEKHLWQIEASLFREADQVVSLTEAGRTWLLERALCDQVTVIPCCADVDRFTCQRSAGTESLRLISVGSLGPGYLPEAVFRVYDAFLQRHPDAQLRLVTRSDESAVRAAASRAGVDWGANITIGSLSPADVPEAIAEADIGLCMVEPSKAKVASSPTKLAEYLAAGKPVVACDGCGDVRSIIETNLVGAIVDPYDFASDFSAVKTCATLLDNPRTSERCRALAESEFSLATGVDRYLNVYSDLLAGRICPPTGPRPIQKRTSS